MFFKEIKASNQALTSIFILERSSCCWTIASSLHSCSVENEQQTQFNGSQPRLMGRWSLIGQLPFGLYTYNLTAQKRATKKNVSSKIGPSIIMNCKSRSILIIILPCTQLGHSEALGAKVSWRNNSPLPRPRRAPTSKSFDLAARLERSSYNEFMKHPLR